MRLSGWCSEEQIRVARFQRWWLEKNDIDPDPGSYPLDMEPGDWDEQYQMWKDE